MTEQQEHALKNQIAAMRYLQMRGGHGDEYSRWLNGLFDIGHEIWPSEMEDAVATAIKDARDEEELV